MQEYYPAAPWDKIVKIITIVVFALLGGVFVFAGSHVIGVLVPVLIIGIGATFAVRGYSIQDDVLVIHHLFWERQLSLDQLKSVETNPIATSASIRTFGSGGLFGYIGYFRNRTLGHYLAYVTNPRYAVVLYFEKRTIVISPENTVDFVEHIYTRIRY